MAGLFDPLTLREVTLRNRVVMGPMMQYSAERGRPTAWHLPHLVSRAVGGAGVVVAERTAALPEGRSTPKDTGLWDDDQVEAWRPITGQIAEAGAVPAIQVGHAGRKGSIRAPWEPRVPLPAAEGGWETVAPSPLPYGPDRPDPRALSRGGIEAITEASGLAAGRAAKAGFRLLEVHGAHGYLPHQFLSPLTNRRDDEFGGSFENRGRFLLGVVRAIRERWPSGHPLAVRLSISDGVEGGWMLADTVRLVPELMRAGVDVVDCSIGGATPAYRYPSRPGFLVPAARQVRAATGIVTGVGWEITDPRQADEIVGSEAADLVVMARQFLREPFWPLRAAHDLGAAVAWPVQYERGRWPSAALG